MVVLDLNNQIISIGMSMDKLTNIINNYLNIIHKI